MNANNNKAVGIDYVSYELLKNKDVIAIMYSLFSALFETKQTPTIWKKLIIHPIPKGHVTKIDPLLYRGLALQSCVYKLYSSLINMRVVNFLEDGKHLSDVQNGFRKNRGCNQHIFMLNELCKLRLARDRSTFLCYVDFSKAFDYLDRELLVVRLMELGVQGKILNAIKNSYSHTLNAV